MRAAVMRDRRIVVDDVPDPKPADGQVLVKTLACGICGSDLHALQHADQMMEVAAEAGVPQSTTGVVGLDGVVGAFEDLGRPEEHAKILVEPRREG